MDSLEELRGVAGGAETRYKRHRVWIHLRSFAELKEEFCGDPEEAANFVKTCFPPF